MTENSSTNAEPLTDLELERAREGSTYRNERWLATVDTLRAEIDRVAPYLAAHNACGYSFDFIERTVTEDPPCGCDNPLHDHSANPQQYPKEVRDDV